MVAPNTLSNVIKSGLKQTECDQCRLVPCRAGGHSGFQFQQFHQDGIAGKKNTGRKKVRVRFTVFGRDFLHVKKKNYEVKKGLKQK